MAPVPAPEGSRSRALHLMPAKITSFAASRWRVSFSEFSNHVRAASSVCRLIVQVGRLLKVEDDAKTAADGLQTNQDLPLHGFRV